ncbi:MAG: NAD-binding protein [Planctomycetota bacterium]|nr:NAD-binding protein [Planctomycetota bacterium]
MPQSRYRQLLKETTRDFREAVWDWLTGQSWRAFIVIITSTVIVGTIGYYLVEPGASMLDALYMALITMSTVGYGDVTSTDAGKLFTIFYLVLGVGVFSLSLSRIAAAMVEGRIQAVLGRRRTQMKVNQLKDHIVLCGYGRFGQITAAEFQAKRIPLVALDVDPEVIKDAEEHGILGLVADATEEESLVRAGLERARALCCALPTDAENVYTILTAKDIRPDLSITALARDRKAERKLLFAGAQDVISPYTIGARHMARQVMSPHVAKVVDLGSRGAERRAKGGVYMEEVLIGADSPLVNTSLKESPIRKDFNVMVVAIVGHDGKATFNPGPNHVMNANDVLVSVGGDEGLRQLEDAADFHPDEPDTAESAST